MLLKLLTEIYATEFSTDDFRDKCYLIMAKATGLIFSLLDVVSAQEVTLAYCSMFVLICGSM